MLEIYQKIKICFRRCNMYQFFASRKIYAVVNIIFVVAGYNPSDQRRLPTSRGVRLASESLVPKLKLPPTDCQKTKRHAPAILDSADRKPADLRSTGVSPAPAQAIFGKIFKFTCSEVLFSTCTFSKKCRVLAI
jgi:hypothetical protein